MSLLNFSVVAALETTGILNAGEDTDLLPIVGDVIFTPQFQGTFNNLNMPVRPTAFKLRQRRAMLDSSGFLKEVGAAEYGVRLPANDPVYGIAALVYRVDFQVTAGGLPVSVDSVYFPAPDTDTTLPLVAFLKDAEALAIAIRPKVYVEDILDFDYSALDAVTTTTVTVKPSGGDFTSPKLACQSISSSNPGPKHQFEVLVYPGIYPDYEWTVSAYTTLRGVGRRGQVWLKGELPVTSTDSQIANNSTIVVGPTCQLVNLKITAKNMRYAVHADVGGTNVDAEHLIPGCHIEHYGNQAVIDYRAANGLPAGSVWNSDRPWGYGSASGVVETFTDTALVGHQFIDAAYYAHNNVNFAKPTVNTLERCRLIKIATSGTSAQSMAVLVQGLGSGQIDRLDLVNCEVSGGNYIQEMDSPWLPTNDAGQYANHSDFKITAVGTTVLGWKSTNRGKALKITSASTSNPSSVRVSGTAADVLFGTSPIYRDGGGSIQGYAYGDLDISGILTGSASNTTVNNTLGRRLGNCSVTSKTLTVVVDGGSPINIVFSTNLTSASNATILSTINTALSTAATAAEYLVSQGEVYPDFLDRQETLYNNQSEGIPRWAPVKKAWGGIAQLFGTTDPPEWCYGIALEPIPPNSSGRILTEGLLFSEQLIGTPTIDDNVAIFHSNVTTSAMATSGTRPFGLGMRNGLCYFKGSGSEYGGAGGTIIGTVDQAPTFVFVPGTSTPKATSSGGFSNLEVVSTGPYTQQRYGKGWVEWEVNLAAGIWALDLWHLRNSYDGIYTITANGSAVGTIDGYVSSGSNVNTVSTITGITIPVSGRYSIRFNMLTKNASSSDTYGQICGFGMTRTASK